MDQFKEKGSTRCASSEGRFAWRVRQRLGHRVVALVVAIPALWAAVSLHAQQVVSDTLTGASSTYGWIPFNGACLTAGNNTGSIPACVGLPYYGSATLVGGTSGLLPDIPGNGALRLTNGGLGGNGNAQSGAVVASTPFSSHAGIQVTFTTVTYGGNGNAYQVTGSQPSGADGIGFFLSDASVPATVGALGGSLGYSCSNENGTYDGVVGGYLGIGIDEFGNFSNPWDNTNSGPGYIPGQISVRGAGNTAWSWLNANYPMLYPSALSASSRAAAVQNTCRTGYLWNYNSVAGPQQTTTKLAYNYPYLAGSTLPVGNPIYSQEVTPKPLRGLATPITYSLSITQNGLMNFSFSYNGGSPQPVFANTSITQSNGPLPANFRFGFSAGTGGGSNVHEITCFKAAPLTSYSSTAGSNSPAQRTVTGDQIFQAYFQPLNFWGGLKAWGINVSSTGTATVATTPTWDASCVLTGGACLSTGAATSTAEAPTARSILSYNGSSGIPFEFANLTSAQQTALSLGDTANSDLRVRYLRGDRSNEIANGGTLRTRTSVLGDIVDSSPTWVGPPQYSYPAVFKDALYSSDPLNEPLNSYAGFQSTYAQRTNVVYAGANDGLLHGFRAGYFIGQTFQQNSGTIPNDGHELLAYMPAGVVSMIHATQTISSTPAYQPALDFSNPLYSHNFFVDATPGTGDLYYAGAWHTWLVGGTGFGGNATGPIDDNSTIANGVLFALDITDPTQFVEGNAASLVKGEWNQNTLSCVAGGGGANCGANLGSTVGTPIIRRLHNGSWAILFGNGLNSPNGGAGLFIMLVDSATGAVTSRYYLDTGAGPITTGSSSTVTRNGIASVTSADLDGDHITDYVYAGDAFGNLWRFDLTSQSPSNWAVTPGPLFKTSSGQPITTPVLVSQIPVGGANGKLRLIVSFGTGQQYPQTLTSAAQFATAPQALYGIWDANMAAWNTLAPATAQYATVSTPPVTVPSSALQAQSISVGSIIGGVPTRTVTNNPVCWADQAACSGPGAPQYGWTDALPSAGEQVIYNPTYYNSVFLVNTYIPAAAVASNQCTPPTPSGWTMAVNIANGGATPKSFFLNYPQVSGIYQGSVGSSTILSTGTSVYAVSLNQNGNINLPPINPAATAVGARVNWAQLR